MPLSERSSTSRERKNSEKAATSSQTQFDGTSFITKSHADIPSVSSLLPRPCYTCGREITPRAKWARNWESIRYCSDHCKGWKNTVRVCPIEGGIDLNDFLETFPPESEILKSCITERDGFLLLHLDAWIETTIFRLIDRNASVRGKGVNGLIALEQVSDDMKAELTSAETNSRFCHAIKDKILQQSPGLREMIRRAARRLVILNQKDWPSTQVFGHRDIQLELSQEKGKHVLRTLQDVSLAKGEMYIQKIHK